MTEPRTGEVSPVGPAGTSSGTPAAGAGSSGRVGRTYVPEVRDDSAGGGDDATTTRTLPRVDDRATEVEPDAPAAAAPPPSSPPPAAVGRPPVPPAPPSRPLAQSTPPVGTVAPGRQRRGVRRARLRLTRIDPWSALKVSLVFAAFLFVVWMIAVIVLFAILQGAGVFGSVNSTLSDVFGEHIDFSGAVILGGAAVIGALSVVIVTALGTIVAFAYNVTAALLGGLDVTLTEQE